MDMSGEGVLFRRLLFSVLLTPLVQEYGVKEIWDEDLLFHGHD